MADRPMRVGVIGSGLISGVYLQNMIERFDNLEVMAVASLHLKNAQKSAEKFGIRACSVRELMEDSEIEMIVNLTPVGTHYEIIKAALEAGKHVYTEKTITDNVVQAKELMQLAKEKELYLGAAPDTFLGAALQTARMTVDSGMLGEIHSFAISANRNNDLCTSMFPFLRQPGAGILNDYGVYYLTALVSLLGPVARVVGLTERPYTNRKNIFSKSAEFGQEIETPNESIVAAVLQLQNGIFGTLHINAESVLVDEAYFAIYGTKGILYLTDPNQFGGKVTFQSNTMDPHEKRPRTILWSMAKYSVDSRGLGPSEMAAAIRSKRESRVSAKMAVHVLEVLDGMIKSEQCGKIREINTTCSRPSALQREKIEVQTIGHITYTMKYADDMLDFYINVLGMQPVFTLKQKALYEALKKSYDNRVCTDEELCRLEQIHKNAEKPWLIYLRIDERKFLELFYDLGETKRTIEKRWMQYGFMKVNYEVEDIYAIRECMQEANIPLLADIHKTAEGYLELSVLDPDGNEVQFTQYLFEENGLLPLDKASSYNRSSVTAGITQLAFQVMDTVNMRNFYCYGLGFPKVAQIKYEALKNDLEKQGGGDKKLLEELEIRSEEPWIEYIEVAPRQYIKLFYPTGGEKRVERNLEDCYGYQHYCLEVQDIQQVWNTVKENGIIPDTDINMGEDGAYQFWVTDPDGNRIEFMEYRKDAKQLM